jgi:cytochrome bd-type quinol oxidase subunit 2
MSMATKAHEALATTERAADSKWLDRTARLGFVARGVVYAIVAGIALRIAIGDGSSQQANKQGALQAIADQPFGRGILVVLAIGLAGYALWRLSEAVTGYRDEDDEKKRTAKRLASAGKGLIYVAFCVSAISVIAGGSSGNGEQQPKSWTARVLEWPAGSVLVAIAGLLIVAGGIFLVVRGLTTKFEEQLETGRMSPPVRRTALTVGLIGSVGRGIVFGLLGILLVGAAIDHDPNEAQGIDGTLRTIADRSYGQALLFVTALALFAFAAYSFVEARYRKL